jgi:Fic/DOC family
MMPDNLRAGERYTGQMALVVRFNLPVPHPNVISIVGSGQRRQALETYRSIDRYLPSYDYGDAPVMDLKFALRYEPIDLGILRLAFEHIVKGELEDWVRREPNGTFARRAWFFYEWLTNDQLNLPDVGPVGYTPALDPDKHIVIPGEQSRRHRVTNNLLGTPALCPVIRRTRRIEDCVKSEIKEEAAALVQGCDPQILAKAINYLYTKETRETFALEGEVASGSKAERFIDALRSVRDFHPGSEEDQTRLQNVIVDPRYAASGWRDFQNFVGETTSGHREIVHFICPKPEDLHSLMDGFAALVNRLKGTDIDPVLAAAVISFAFVFIHPFDDGNGRIHRYLIHHMLDEAGFTPPGVLFPVSAAIVRNQAAYDVALERFSRAIASHIDWAWRDSGSDMGPTIMVKNRTDYLYRYFDATPQAEYLYDCVIDTVRRDLREEVLFVEVFDRAINAVMDRIDMPNRKAAQLVKLVMQNGRIGSDKRARLFPELTVAEIDELETTVRAASNPPAGSVQDGVSPADPLQPSPR